MADNAIVKIDDVKIRKKSVEDYAPAEINPVKHSAKNKKKVKDSLDELKFGRPILSAEDEKGRDVLVAGHNTIEQAKELGYKDVIEIETEGDVIIVHKRKDLTEAEQYRMASFDNAAAKGAVFDAESIQKIEINKGVRLDGIFSQSMLEGLAKSRENDGGDGYQGQGAGDGDTGSGDYQSDNNFYVVVELKDKESQEGLFEYLKGEGYDVMKYDGKGRR